MYGPAVATRPYYETINTADDNLRLFSSGGCRVPVSTRVIRRAQKHRSSGNLAFLLILCYGYSMEKMVLSTHVEGSNLKGYFMNENHIYISYLFNYYKQKQ